METSILNSFFNVIEENVFNSINQNKNSMKEKTMKEETETFDLSFVKGHPTININGRIFVVDTGSPASFSYTGTIPLLGREYTVPYGEFILDDLNRVLETRVDGLIGGEILKRVGAVEFDYPHNTITFHDILPDVSGSTEIDVRVFLNYLVFDMEIDGQQRRVFLDSGAPIPYLCNTILPKREPDGYVEDVTPSGSFSSPVYEMKSELAGKMFNVRYGKLPAVHQVVARTMGCAGVVGKDIFDLGKVTISYGQGKMYIQLNENEFNN